MAHMDSCDIQKCGCITHFLVSQKSIRLHAFCSKMLKNAKILQAVIIEYMTVLQILEEKQLIILGDYRLNKLLIITRTFPGTPFQVCE